MNDITKENGFSKKNSLKKTSDTLFQAGKSKSQEFLSDAGALVKKLDDALEISKNASEGLNKAKKVAQKSNEKYDLTGKVEKANKAAKEALDTAIDSDAGRKVARASKITRKVVQDNLTEPAAKALEALQLEEVTNKAKDKLINGIGVIRESTKTYYAPESADELLRQTRDILIDINASILQVSADDAYDFSQRFGKAIVSKIAGATSAGALILAANTFGLASTGTAIGTLSGAAHTSAYTAWLGGFVGSGSAAGVAITGGVALFAGLAVYASLKNNPRAFDDLPDKEKGIVQACSILIAAIDDWLVKPNLDFDVVQAEVLLKNTLLPLLNVMNEAEPELKKNLDLSKQFRLTKVVLPDFNQQVIEGFKYYIKAELERRRKLYPAYAVAGVIYAFITESTVGKDEESQLALAALRRSNNIFTDANESEITATISDYNAGQLRGLTNNVKGIYHEMLFKRDYEATHPQLSVELFPSTTHPGADARITDKDSGEIVQEVQLKAGSSDGLITSHYAKYPDIDVLATEELAKSMGIETSGISNAEITKHVRDQLDDMADNTLLDRATEAAGFSGLAAAGLQAAAVLKGDRPLGEAGKQVLSSMGVAAASTLLAGLLL